MLKNLCNLLEDREQIFKNKRTFRVGYIEETSEILNEFLKENMIAMKKALTVILKDIDTVFHTIGAGLYPKSIASLKLIISMIKQKKT